MGLQKFSKLILTDYKQYLEANKNSISESNLIINHEKILELESKNLVEFNLLLEKQFNLYFSKENLNTNITAYNILLFKERQQLDLDFIEFIFNHNDKINS